MKTEMSSRDIASVLGWVGPCAVSLGVQVKQLGILGGEKPSRMGERGKKMSLGSCSVLTLSPGNCTPTYTQGYFRGFQVLINPAPSHS